jgi:hypothetical protein
LDDYICWNFCYLIRWKRHRVSIVIETPYQISIGKVQPGFTLSKSLER